MKKLIYKTWKDVFLSQYHSAFFKFDKTGEDSLRTYATATYTVTNKLYGKEVYYGYLTIAFNHNDKYMIAFISQSLSGIVDSHKLYSSENFQTLRDLFYKVDDCVNWEEMKKVVAKYDKTDI